MPKFLHFFLLSFLVVSLSNCTSSENNKNTEESEEQLQFGCGTPDSPKLVSNLSYEHFRPHDRLFMANCSNCHSMIEDNIISGPSLHNVSRMPQESFIKITQNILTAAADGDSFAIRSIEENQHKFGVMTVQPLNDSLCIELYKYLCAAEKAGCTTY